MESMLLAAHPGAWGPGAWWPIFPLLWFALFWGFLIFFGLRWRRGWGRRDSGEAVLAERYAHGEIGVQEYRERLSVLKENR
jgi:putative membrane protein